MKNVPLTSITIPNRDTTIGDYAFEGCAMLSSISVDNKNSNYQSIDDVLFKKGKDFTLMKYPPQKSDTEYTIPAKVVEISEGAFGDCINLKTVKFCGTLNDYSKNDVVTGLSLFNVFVTPEFGGASFFGSPTTRSLTEEDCPRETTSSKSYTGVIIGCVCGAVALIVIVVVVVWFMKSKPKNEGVAMKTVS